MCGISGIFVHDGVTDADLELVKTFNELQLHRGPDDDGLYRGNRCALGHRRLSIIDLSRDGRQPMFSPDGRYRIVFNGEIYNYLDLREEFARDWIFRTKTDTEVLLAAFILLGPDCLRRLNGMFAFAIYDEMEKTLFLARDRFGIKPLYYVVKDRRFYFASEIKALYAIPGLTPSANMQSLFDYLVFNRTDIHDETFTNEIRRLPKGTHALWDADGLRLKRWWSPETFLDETGDPDPDEVARRIEELSVSAMILRMRSDVPVGSCLSGGLDSSILTGVLYKRAGVGRDFQVFTAAYPGHPADESAYVDAFLRRYPFLSRRVSPDGASALADFDRLCWHNDEPTTGCSIYAQYAVMRLAKTNGVTTLLDGQGGDENFAGYQYFHGFHLAGLLRRGRLGAFARELSAILLRRQEISALQTLAYQMLPRNIRRAALLRAAALVTPEFFHAYIDQSLIERKFFSARNLNESLALHFHYKLEHLLRTEDRNSMAFSLEARTPYLDYRLVEYLLSLPAGMKIACGETKRLQKLALGHYTIPEILYRRDKIGFVAPGEQWMRLPGWREATKLAMTEIKRAFPGVFRSNAFPATADQQWKINSLAAWRRLFLDGGRAGCRIQGTGINSSPVMRELRPF